MKAPVQQPIPFSHIRPATDAQLRAHELPFDVQVGDTVFRKGTTLFELVEQHRAFYGRLYQGKEDL